MKRLSEQTLYEILEVASDAAADEIEGAWRRARDLYAPGSLATYSLMAPEDAAALSERIEEAKRVLLDSEARARYDAGLAAAASEVGAAVRIAATGTNAVTATPPRPYLVAPVSPARTPSPPPRASEPPREKAAAPANAPPAEGTQPGAERAAQPADPLAPPAPPPEVSPGPIQLSREVAAEAPQRELSVPEGAVWGGEALRRARESRGLSVREVCDRTKITRYHLENIEADRYTLLPAPVYLRGIIVAVARELRLDGQKVARSYLERMAAATPPGR